ncbi:MAG TPA: hypothetical protein VIT45_13570 [Allosphingosinicella sp.]
MRLPTTLPQLAGRGLLAFRLAWGAVLMLALVVPLAGALHFSDVEDRLHYNPFREFGLRGQVTGSLLGQPFGVEAKRTGIVRGATLLAIDGTPVPPGSSRREIASRLAAAGPQVRLVTRTPEGEVRRHLLTRDKQAWARHYEGSGISREQRRLLFMAIGLLTAAIAIFAAVLLTLRRPRDPVVALFSFGLLCQAASAHVAVVTWFALGAGAIGAILFWTGIGALTLGMLVFPQGRFEPRWSRWLPIPVLLWTLVHFADYGPRELSTMLKNVVSAALFLLCLATVLIRFRRLPPGMERQQVRWALHGFALAATSSFAYLMVTAAFARSTDELALIWASLAGVLLQMLVTLFIAGGLLVSLLRYRLYDAEAAISRSAGYALLTLTLGAVFAASAKLLETFFESTFGRDAGMLPGALGAGLAVALITPLHRRIQDWAERRFQKALLHLRRDLPACVDDLRETASLGQLLDEVLARVEAGARAVRSAVTIDGRLAAVRGIEGKDLDAGLFPVSVPLRVGHAGSEVGALLVGPRPDGTRLGADEREVLEEIADPIARAIRVVMARQEREAATKKALAAIQRRLTRIEKGSRDG